MVRNSQRKVAGLRTSVWIVFLLAFVFSFGGAYEVIGAKSYAENVDFVPLEDGHHLSKRQVSNQSNNKWKINVDKLFKNLPFNDEKRFPALFDGEEYINDTDVAMELANTTQVHVIEDHHTYYNSTVLLEPYLSAIYWVDLDNMSQGVTHEMLSKSYRKAATINLSFDFPFYGHIVRNVTIATGGFIYTGDYMHSWLASTQYIAPLMANFDTRLGEKSHVRYADNGTHFIVQWEDVVLQDTTDAGSFTFQVILKDNGDIIFVYKSIPVSIHTIPDEEHPVKVGLSDAYIIERTFFYLKKVIYEYHRIEIRKEKINNDTAVYLKALPNCLTQKTCKSCLTTETTLVCEWCEQAQRCSDGMDRHRQDWVIKGCEKQLNDRSCLGPAGNESPSYNSPATHTSTEMQFAPASSDASSDATTPFSSTFSSVLLSTSYPTIVGIAPEIGSSDEYKGAKSSVGTSGVIAILLAVVVLVAMAGWIVYAYRNPHTPSGQLIIKYRPTQWHWAKGETPYTAASVHI